MDEQLAELFRLIANLLRIGVVEQIDGKRARIRIGKNLTNWLPWFAIRAGNTRTWSQPSIGEQVMVLSPGGDLTAGIVLPAIYSDAHDAPTTSPSLQLAEYPDGALVSYDHAAHALAAVLPDGSSATVTANSITANADRITANAPETTCTGNLTVAKNLIVKGNSALNGGASVTPGKGQSSAIKINGRGEVTEDWIVAGISSAHHQHDKIKRGEEVSGGPK